MYGPFASQLLLLLAKFSSPDPLLSQQTLRSKRSDQQIITLGSHLDQAPRANGLIKASQLSFPSKRSQRNASNETLPTSIFDKRFQQTPSKNVEVPTNVRSLPLFQLKHVSCPTRITVSHKRFDRAL
mmetsp:Transcript_39830/g.59079  ORF Transcript_39830/g.59079 Transcript_39830/m.59079 type:complete len:127 (-) Transcript_39830:465-845(-)